MNQRKIGILISYVNILVHAVLGFVYVPILLHYIGKNEYGLYQLIGSLISYFSIMDFGLTAAVTRYYSKFKALNDKVNMENLLALAARGYAIVTGIILAIGFCCFFFIDYLFGNSMSIHELTEAKKMFVLLLINIAITVSTMIFRAIINSHEKFLFLKGLETIQLILQPACVILILQKAPSAFSVALVQTILNFGLIFCRGYYCFAKLKVKIKYHYWDKELVHGFKRLSSDVFVETIVDQVFWKTNQILLGIIRGTAAVAVYSISSLVYMNYMALSTAISGVYLPHVTEMVAKNTSNKDLSDLFTQIGRWQYFLLGLVATGFIIFGQKFIELWAGPGFSDSYWITILIIIPFTVDLIQNIGLSILQAKNQYAFRARIYSCVGILNLCLALPLGIRYGGIGCAIATGISMFVGNGLGMNWYYSKYIGLDIKNFWYQIGNISKIILLCLLIGYGLNAYIISSSKLVFLLKILGYTVIYGVMIYFMAMSPGEKEKVRGIGQKFI